MDELQFSNALREGRPYFGLKMAAQQGDPRRKGYMRPIFRHVADEFPTSPIEILEIGSWAGASAVAWAKALEAERRAGSVVCVDHWRPYLDTGINSEAVYREMTAAVDDDAIYRLFRHNIRACGADGRVVEMRGASQDLLPRLALESFHIVYVDGSHAYGDVYHDIRHAMELVRPGGIVCGDDLELQLPDCDPDFLRRASDDGRDYVKDPRTGCFFHPGVTRAVAEIFGDVMVRHGIWCMQKAESSWRRIDGLPDTVSAPDYLADRPDEPFESPRRLARINDPAIVISIIVNYFDRPSTLVPVVNRLLSQSLRSCTPDQVEIIVVDDGSGDSAARNRLPDRVTYLWQRRDRYGIARAKNLGAKVANGRTLVFLDADILVEEDYVEAVLRAFAEWHPRVVHCGYIRDYHHPGAPDPRLEFGVWENPGMPNARFLQLAGGNLAIGRSLFVESGGFDEDLIYGGVEDLLFGYQLGRLPRTAIRFDKAMMARHLPHPPSPAHANPAASWNVVKKKHADFYETYMEKGLR